MARGVARQYVFRDAADRRRFLAGVGAAIEAGQLEVEVLAFRRHKHSALRASDVARRCDRSHLAASPAAHTRAEAGTAVALAVRDLDAAARRDTVLAMELRRLVRRIGAAGR